MNERRYKSQMPERAFMRKAHRDIAAEYAIDDVGDQFAAFKDWALASGAWSWDWDQTWREWCIRVKGRRDEEFEPVAAKKCARAAGFTTAEAYEKIDRFVACYPPARRTMAKFQAWIDDDAKDRAEQDRRARASRRSF